MEPVERTCRSAAATRLAARRKFGGYKPEKPKTIRNVKVQSSTVATLTETWIDLVNNSDGENHNKAIAEATLSAAKKFSCSPEDIRAFSALLKDFEHIFHPFGDDCEHDLELVTGYFLSALINQSPAQNFSVIANTSFDILALGYENTKNIVVEGDSTEEIGSYMKSGMILVGGCTFHCTGNAMKGGIIIVEDITKGPIANDMEGGLLILNSGLELGSRSKEWVAWGMKGGEIQIYGEIWGNADFSRIIKGKIYHNGKLIVDK